MDIAKQIHQSTLNTASKVYFNESTLVHDLTTECIKNCFTFVSGVNVEEQVKQNWAKWMPYVQSHFVRRIHWIRFLINHFHTLAPSTNYFDDETFFTHFKLVKKGHQLSNIGKGSYAEIYKVVSSLPHLNTLPLVVKIQRFYADGGLKIRLEDANCELVCNYRLNQLLFQQITPHLVFTPVHFWTKTHSAIDKKEVVSLYTIHECADGNLKELILMVDEKVFFNFFVQVSVALAQIAVHCKAAHNDLTFRNILYNNTLVPTNSHRMDTSKGPIYYKTANSKFLLKIADWGLANLEDYPSIQIEKKTKFQKLDQLDYIHISELDGLNKYVVDIFIWVWQMYRKCVLRGMNFLLKTYFESILKDIQIGIFTNPNYMKTPEDLTHFVHSLFSEKYMSPELKHVVEFQIQSS